MTKVLTIIFRISERKNEKSNQSYRETTIPELDIYEYAVERGFAESPEATTMGETFSEINDQTEITPGGDIGHAGENYHGEWY